MLATAIIVFREALEAALIVSIVMAACRGLKGRNLWVLTGIFGGLAGAGAGTAAGALTGNEQVTVGAESPLTFNLENPVTVRVMPGAKQHDEAPSQQ